MADHCHVGTNKGRNKELSPWSPSPKAAPAPEPKRDRKQQKPKGAPRPPAGVPGAEPNRVFVGVLAAVGAFAVFALAPGKDAESSASSGRIEAAAISVPTTARPAPTTTAAKPAPTVVTTRIAPPTTAATTTAPPTTEAPPEEPSTTTAPPTTTGTTTRSTTSTTTTTAPPTTASRNLLVRDISTSRLSQGETWVAIATVTVQDDTGQIVAGVRVEGDWSIPGQASSCTTDGSGKCSLYLYSIPAATGTVTLTMSYPSPGLSRTINRPN